MSTPLPVIVAIGGISPAGRSSENLGYQRLIFEHLSPVQQHRVLLDLALLQGRIHYRDGGYQSASNEPVTSLADTLEQQKSAILNDTLVRALNPDTHFDPHRVPRHRRLNAGKDTPLRVSVATNQLPNPLPAGCTVIGNSDGRTEIELQAGTSLLLEHTYELPLAGAGQFPGGFNPQSLYPSKSHPRALAGSIFAASDAINSSGLDIDALVRELPPNQVSVYSGSAFGQVDEHSMEGAATSRYLDSRISSRHVSFALPEMSADFVNAYVLGATARVGYAVGACATFLYNLQRGMDDITSGRSRLVLVGGAECPLVPTLVEGLLTMGALVDWNKLRTLDGLKADAPYDSRRISRPFCHNTGFTPSESCQFTILMDDSLALELGAHILGAPLSCHTHADGYKKSISSPGVGNYITVSQCLAQVRAIFGDAATQKSFVLAHGTSTPQNRVTESHILNTAATAFGIDDWPIAAPKAHLGHSMAAAAGDQLLVALGFWQHGWLPGIQSGPVAEDVYTEHLEILLQDAEYDPQERGIALLNSKGFGGNNATAAIASPTYALRMMNARHGSKRMQQHAQLNEAVQERSESYSRSTALGDYQPRYRFNHNVNGGLNTGDVELNAAELKLRNFDNPVRLDTTPNPWEDMIEED